MTSKVEEAELLYRFIDGSLENTSKMDFEVINSIWNKAILLRHAKEYEKALNLLKTHIKSSIFRALYGEVLLLTEDFKEGINILSNIDDITALPLSLKISVILSHLKKIDKIQDEASLKNLKKDFLFEEGIKLNILFLALHNNLTGGAKIFFEYANRLSNLGHNVCITAKIPPPDWYKIDVPWIIYQEQIPRFKIAFPDIVFSMFWTLVPTSLDINSSVKILLEQGDPTIYEPERFPQTQIKFMDRCYLSPIKIFVVSKNLKQLIKKRYNREAFYIPNGIDTNLFKPIPQKNNEIPIILLVGADEIYFKGLKEVFEALQILRNKGYKFKVRQVTQTGKVIYNFDREIIVKPPQEKLAYLYATSDIFVSGSYFETFHLPPIEAMASGTAVITTDNGGVEYCTDRVNALIVPPKDVIALSNAIESLLIDKSLRDRLAYEGIKTARMYSWDKIIKIVEDELYNMVSITSIFTSKTEEFKSLIPLKDKNYIISNAKANTVEDTIKKYIEVHSKEDSVNLIIVNSPGINEEDILKIVNKLSVNPEDIPDIILIEEPISELDLWSIKQYLDILY